MSGRDSDMQPALFAAPRVCPICHATRAHDDPRATACHWDRSPFGAIRDEHRRRPAACLNTIDPATAPIPY